MQDERRTALVIGAGPAGLAAAAELGRHGVRACVLDRALVVGSSWRERYDRLRLNTARCHSGLPGMSLDRSLGQWVGRDDYVAYLERYAIAKGLRVELGVEVSEVIRDASRWSVVTPVGPRHADAVVVATGFDRVPFMPEWRGVGGFVGEVLHASAYRNAERFRGRDVLVVGLGSTGSEIAVDLIEGGARSVAVSTRTPPNLFPRSSLGVPSSLVARPARRLPAAALDRLGAAAQRVLWGDLEALGLPRPTEGVATALARRGHGITVDGGLVAELRRGRGRIVAALERFEGREVVLVDGSRLSPEVVIAATGYRRGLQALVGGLGVLDESGRPLAVGGEHLPTAPGLHFIGYRLPISGQLPELRADARSIAVAVARSERQVVASG